VLLLVDSGSSHSFMSSKIAAVIEGSSLLLHPLSVVVANGNMVMC
jgi:hypothetical protein